MSPQEIYDAAIANGCSPLLADMLAHQKAPGTMGTDGAWIEGMHEDPKPGGSEKEKQFFLQRAKAAGVKTNGKTYIGQLGAAEDQKAWVSDLNEYKAVCRENNLGLSINGKTVVEKRPTSAPKAPKLSDKIVNRFMAQELAVNPKANKRELREKIIDRHAPKWKE